jgi:glycosyltransferase involved in cell wall biosynthesis
VLDMQRFRIAVVTPDVLAPSMAGPAIRAVRIAEALAGEHEVELLSTERCELSRADLQCAHVSPAGLAGLADRFDVVVVQGAVLRNAPALRKSDAVIVVDLYDPFQLEALELSRGLPAELRRISVGTAVDLLNEQLRRGDFFLCASERQRDFWIGQLAAVGRVNEIVYDATPDLRGFLSVVPFGIDEQPPVGGAPAMREVVPGIGVDDEILYWGGGIYNWFDPLTLIHAVAALVATRPRLRLFFAGTRHPSADADVMHMLREARELADGLGLTDRHVFFHDWVPFAERGRFLLEADIGVSTHFDHVETAYSFRTRILDYLWAGLPTVTTAGDVLADLLTASGAGAAVPPTDVEALTAVLAELLDDGGRRDSMSRAATSLGHDLQWSRVLAPLVEYCRAPHRAPDLLDATVTHSIHRGGDLLPHLWVRRGQRAIAMARRGDWGELRERVNSRWRGRAPGAPR